MTRSWCAASLGPRVVPKIDRWKSLLEAVKAIGQDVMCDQVNPNAIKVRSHCRHHVQRKQRDEQVQDHFRCGEHLSFGCTSQLKLADAFPKFNLSTA